MDPVISIGARRLAARFDHTLLGEEVDEDQVRRLVAEALEYGFRGVCVPQRHVGLAARLLDGHESLVVTVAGFPTGLEPGGQKAAQAREAVERGADEVDMVLNRQALAARDHRLVWEDTVAVVEAASPGRIKVILETAALDDEETAMACAIACSAGAAFVKTSTGFGPGGATPERVSLMKRCVGPSLGVKASGGIRTLEDSLAMIRAGADVIGSSSSVAILRAFLDHKSESS